MSESSNHLLKMADALDQCENWAMSLETSSVYQEQLKMLLEVATQKLERARAALQAVADGPHEGEGFCYGTHGVRPCRCHVADARQALEEIK